MDWQEIEVKFYVKHLAQVEKRLQDLGADLVRPRTFETNLRFDLPDGSLRREGRALRLRKDDQARITFKGPTLCYAGVRSRPEFETTLENFETGQKILEALGYVVVATYEKFRSIYELDGLHIMLDELPYGDFVEIEGPDVETLKSAAGRLGLDFGAAIPAGYLSLFEDLCQKRNLDTAQLTFSALNGMQIDEETLAVRPADG